MIESPANMTRASPSQPALGCVPDWGVLSLQPTREMINNAAASSLPNERATL